MTMTFTSCPALCLAWILRAVMWLALAVLLTGCPSYRAKPVDPRATGGLAPTIENPDVGLVGIAPGFTLDQYQVLVVEPFVVSPAEIKDEADIQLAKDMSAYLHARIVSKLAADRTLPRVVDATASADVPTGPGILALKGDISRLTEGSQALRYFVGFGSGSAKAQVETRLVATQSGEVLFITADRRMASGGIGGGDSRAFLTAFMDRIADGLVKVFHQLATGRPLNR